MTTSLNALEALLQFRRSLKEVRRHRNYTRSDCHPVPNPLDPSQPNLIESDMPTSCTINRRTLCTGTVSQIKVPNPLTTISTEKCALSHSSTLENISANRVGSMTLPWLQVKRKKKRGNRKNFVRVKLTTSHRREYMEIIRLNKKRRLKTLLDDKSRHLVLAEKAACPSCSAPEKV